jgi:pilus assembly protein CpaB
MGRKWAIVVAVIFGALAVFLTNMYFQQKEEAFRVEEAQVLIASEDIAKGAVIDYDMLGFKLIPVDFIEPKALGSKESAVGKTAMVTIMEGEQVLSGKLAAPGVGGLTLANKTPPGKRAFTIGLEEASAVGGMLRPGDHVDVLGIFTNPSIILALFQDILVLAVGQEMIAEKEEKPRRAGIAGSRGRETVTLALTPQEVQIITVAMQQGKLRLTLRPRMEVSRALPAVDLSQLPPAVDLNTLLQFYIRRPPPPPSVEIIRGLKKETTNFAR